MMTKKKMAEEEVSIAEAVFAAKHQWENGLKVDDEAMAALRERALDLFQAYARKRDLQNALRLGALALFISTTRVGGRCDNPDCQSCGEREARARETMA